MRTSQSDRLAGSGDYPQDEGAGVREGPVTAPILASVGLLPPSLAARVHELQRREAWVARRRIAGGCACGHASGTDHCPFCDDGVPTNPNTRAAARQRAVVTLAGFLDDPGWPAWAGPQNATVKMESAALIAAIDRVPVDLDPLAPRRVEVVNLEPVRTRHAVLPPGAVRWAAPVAAALEQALRRR
jgi:hypothetical protein